MDTPLITCPHCRSEIPHGANVCRGCRAEIKYGTPKFFIWLGLLLPIVVGYFIARFLHLTVGADETVAYVVWGIVTLAGWYGCIRVCKRLFKNYVSFIRQTNR